MPTPKKPVFPRKRCSFDISEPIDEWIEAEYLARRISGEPLTKGALVSHALKIGLAQIAPSSRPQAMKEGVIS